MINIAYLLFSFSAQLIGPKNDGGQEMKAVCQFSWVCCKEIISRHQFCSDVVRKRFKNCREVTLWKDLIVTETVNFVDLLVRKEQTASENWYGARRTWLVSGQFTNDLVLTERFQNSTHKDKQRDSFKYWKVSENYFAVIGKTIQRENTSLIA